MGPHGRFVGRLAMCKERLWPDLIESRSSAIYYRYWDQEEIVAFCPLTDCVFQWVKTDKWNFIKQSHSRRSVQAKLKSTFLSIWMTIWNRATFIHNYVKRWYDLWNKYLWNCSPAAQQWKRNPYSLPHFLTDSDYSLKHSVPANSTINWKLVQQLEIAHVTLSALMTYVKFLQKTSHTGKCMKQVNPNEACQLVILLQIS